MSERAREEAIPGPHEMNGPVSYPSCSWRHMTGCNSRLISASVYLLLTAETWRHCVCRSTKLRLKKKKKKKMTFNSQGLFNFVISHMRVSRLQNNTLIISHCRMLFEKTVGSHSRPLNRMALVTNRWHTMKTLIAQRFCMIVLVPRLSAHT